MHAPPAQNWFDSGILVNSLQLHSELTMKLVRCLLHIAVAKQCNVSPTQKNKEYIVHTSTTIFSIFVQDTNNTALGKQNCVDNLNKYNKHGFV